MRLTDKSTTNSIINMQEASSDREEEAKAKEDRPNQEEQENDGSSSSSPDVVPDHNSASPTTALQRPAVSWAPMDQELAHQKIRDQRRLLKKQHRAIKYLKNEVASLKRKLHDMEEQQQEQQANDVIPGPPMDDSFSLNRRSSQGEHHPSKKTRYDESTGSNAASDPFDCSVDQHSVSVDENCNDPIPLEIQPAPFFNNNNNTPPQQPQVATESEFPNTFKVKNQPIVDPYGDHGTYTGSVSNSTALPHGRGRMVYQDGQRVYKGGWNNGRWHGVGKAIFVNGDTYIGDYHMDQRHGRGRYSWSDGRLYEGDFKADKRHGKGMFQWPDGARFEGEFVNGFREGHGTYVFCGGCKYTGEWKDGRYNGVGSCVWTNGRCYSGSWRDGMRHGRGIETEEDGSVRHDGEWCDDEPVLTNAERKMAVKRKSSTKTQGWFRKQQQITTAAAAAVAAGREQKTQSI